MDREWLADIGGSSLLEVLGIDEVLKNFRTITGQEASGIIYPALSAAGPNWPSGLYRSSYLPDPSSSAGLIGMATECRTRKLSFWLDLSLSMGFAAASSCFIIDPSGTSAAQCCIVSPVSHRILSLLLQEAVSLLKDRDIPMPTGIVLTLQNLWPMGATGDFIEHTCFCSYCSDEYQAAGFNELDRFKVYPNPLNLALQNTGSGLSHIHAFGPHTDRDRLIEYSRAQGFLAADMLKDIKTFASPRESAEWARLQEWATTLLDYIRAKQRITFAALSTVCQEIRRVLPSIKIAIAAEPLEYDWTGGFFFAELLEQNFYDELWTAPDANLRRITKPNTRIYGCARTRYFTQHLFEAIESSRARFRSGTPARNVSLLKNRVFSVCRSFEVAALTSPLTFQTLELTPTCVGVVAPVVSLEHVRQIMALLFPGAPEENEDELETLQSMLEQLSKYAKNPDQGS